MSRKLEEFPAGMEKETFAYLLKTVDLTKSAECRRQEVGKTQFPHRVSF